MIEQDTIKLLRECDAGIKMGVASIDDVLPHVHSRELKNILTECKRRHETLKEELQQRLDRFGDEGKNPNPIAKGMSWMKTTVKMNLEESDATIAELMTDGCNMGVKSLARYLNQYKAADEYSKDIAKKLIHLEAQLATDIRGYL
jgi:DNA gyrase/topoisomerase IV subunit A